MKALWFLPFTFAAGAEGFALFAPYLILVMIVLHLARSYRPAPQVVPVFRTATPLPIDVMPDAQPAL